MTTRGLSLPLVPPLRGVSHALALLPVIAAALVLVVLAPASRKGRGDDLRRGSHRVSGGSALYHRWPGPARCKPVLQRINHSVIFVFIAASYTPIALVVLHGTLAWLLLVVAWTGAGVGVAFSLGWIPAPLAGSYPALGWAAVIAIPQLVGELALTPLILLGAGGLLYSTGAIIHAAQRPDSLPRTSGFHEIFRALVIAAATAH